MMVGMAAARLSVAILIASVLSGCAQTGTTGERDSTVAPASHPVVIALIDSGTSPYYELYSVADDQRYVSSVPVPVRELKVELPAPQQDPVDRDRVMWEGVLPGELYHFSGTRLFAMSFDIESRPYHFVRDAHRHGAATSFLAGSSAPDALILSLQVGFEQCFDTSCVYSPTIADAMEWAASQDWIDVISLSLGYPANAPDEPTIHADMQRFLDASRAAAERGALIVSAAGNEPTPSIGDYFNGAPWMVSVGGMEPTARGEQLVASKTVDVVANYTVSAPQSGRGELEWRRGTSFGAPIVAGTLGEALRLIRAAGPEMPGFNLRAALNASAIMFNATDWHPGPPGREPLPFDLFNSASLPILVQPQMGWGYVNSSLAPEIARRVLENDLAIPPGKEQAAIFQAEWQRAREEYWSRYS